MEASGENNEEEEDEMEECLLDTCLGATPGGGLKPEIVGERTLREGLGAFDLACDNDWPVVKGVSPLREVEYCAEGPQADCCTLVLLAVD